jgi:ATP-dependent DNA helicase DinG
VYVQHAEEAEAAGITLLCQGFSGGQSRMQAEFALAKAPAVIVMTPWTFETIELPCGSVDRLVVQTLPFDHPNHPVVSKRSERYRSAFGEYALPRLKHRLFRLLRTFLRHAKEGAVVSVLDERLRTKPYGKEVLAYLQSLLPKEPLKTVQKAGQMSLL